MKLQDPSLFIEKNFINGEWVDAHVPSKFSVHDPATGRQIGTCPESTKTDAEQAIAAAENAFPTWRSYVPRERSRILRRWYELVLENQDDLATLITLENGKPLVDAQKEVAQAASYLEWFSEEGPRVYGDVIPHSASKNTRVTVLKEPIGVCGLITPWNFPASMLTRKVGPALATGCTVVIKSAGETPFTTNTLVSLGQKAGVPPGVVNVVCALRNTAEIGQTLCESDVVRKISFTGSTRVGKILVQKSSQSLKKLSLELGGNAPFIIFDDADLDLAVEGLLTSKFRCSGQTCVCANRVYLQNGVYKEVISRLQQALGQFKVGNGFDAATTLGPLITDAAAERVSALVQDAIKSGAQLVAGGKVRSDLGPCFYEPTILSNVQMTMKIAQEEIFGPVATLFSFDSEDELLSLANKSDVGLASYIFTRDLNRVTRISEGLQFGMVGVNTGLVADPAAPFGGIKHSGLGREGSKYGVDDFLQTKTIVTGNIVRESGGGISLKMR